MGDSFNVTLPGGAVMTLSEPIPDHLRKQLAKGVLKPVDSAFSPQAEPDGEGGESRVDSPPPADPAAAPAGNASRDEWEAYAVREGVPEDEASGLGREALKAAVDEVHKAAGDGGS